MHFTARLVELLDHPDDCTSKVGFNMVVSTIFEEF